MLLALLYALLRRVIGSGRPSADRELEIEVVVLRHQVKVLSRKVGRPKLRRIDKAFLAACSRVVPRHRWGSFIVAPSTLLALAPRARAAQMDIQAGTRRPPAHRPGTRGAHLPYGKGEPTMGLHADQGGVPKARDERGCDHGEEGPSGRGARAPTPPGPPELDPLPACSGRRDLGMRLLQHRDRVLAHALRALLHRSRISKAAHDVIDTQPFRGVRHATGEEPLDGWRTRRGGVPDPRSRLQVHTRLP